MKKASLLSLLAAAALFTACPAPERNGNNANVSGGGNQVQKTDVNVNANVNANVPPSLSAGHDKDDRSVALIVFYDEAGRPKIVAAPDKLTLYKKKNQKLRFHVFNNLNVNLSSVKVSFAGSNPLDCEFEITSIDAGEDKGSGTPCKIKNDINANGNYKYTVTASGSGVTVPPLDPEIIINATDEGP